MDQLARTLKQPKYIEHAQDSERARCQTLDSVK